MKTLATTLFLFLALLQITAAKGRDFYQIQVYHLTGKTQEQKLENYIKTSYLPALHRAGIKTAGVFKPVASDTASGKQIVIWLPLNSLDQLDKLQQSLAKDETFQTSGADFLKAPFDQVPFQRKESILLKSFPDAPKYIVPKFTTNPSDRIYELRSYEGPTEYLFRQKVKMFNEGGEIKLFKTLEFNALFYGEVISGSSMPNLMYMTTFENMAAHDARWKSFGGHPDWKKLSAIGEYQHTVSKIVKILLCPTEYSDF